MKTYSGIQLHVHYGENEELFLQTLANLRLLASIPGMREGLVLAAMRVMLPKELQQVEKPQPSIVVTECNAYRTNEDAVFCDTCMLHIDHDPGHNFNCIKDKKHGD